MQPLVHFIHTYVNFTSPAEHARDLRYSLPSLFPFSKVPLAPSTPRTFSPWKRECTGPKREAKHAAPSCFPYWLWGFHELVDKR